MHKVFLVLGSDELDKKIGEFQELEVVDRESNLTTLIDLIEFIDVEYLIVNRLLDDSGEDLIEISRRARKKNIKIVMIMSDMKSTDEKKLISALVSNSVNIFLNIDEIEEEKFIRALEDYPEEFNFQILTSAKDKKEEKKKIHKDKSLDEENYVEDIKDSSDDPVIIEKEVYREVQVIANSVITVVSAAPTGKSFISWNLAYALAERDYSVALINIDRCNSSTIFFGIEDEKNIAFKNLSSKTLKDITKSCYMPNDNLKVYTGKFGSKTYLDTDMFFKILSSIRAECDVVIIDTDSDFEDNLITALEYSNLNLFVFDLDNAHIQMNLLLLDKIKKILNERRTIAVINNIYEENKYFKTAREFISELEFKFKEIVSISNAGTTTYDYVYTKTCNYLKDKTNFRSDLESLLSTIRAKEVQKKRKSWRKLFEK